MHSAAFNNLPVVPRTATFFKITDQGLGVSLKHPAELNKNLQHISDIDLGLGEELDYQQEHEREMDRLKAKRAQEDD